MLTMDGGLVPGIVGPLLMAASGVSAVRGYRRRSWRSLLGSLGTEVAWFGVLTVLAP